MTIVHCNQPYKIFFHILKDLRIPQLNESVELWEYTLGAFFSVSVAPNKKMLCIVMIHATFTFSFAIVARY